MNFFYFDASALAKRYAPETGSLLINDLFDKVSLSRFLVLLMGIGEVISVLVRHRNSSSISNTTYAFALTQIQNEIISSSEINLLSLDDNLVYLSFSLIEKHSINATDALVLRSALEEAANLRTQGRDLVMISSDKRLIRASKAEGLLTFNPEIDPRTTLERVMDFG